MGKVSHFSSLIFLIAFSCCAIPVEADPIRILAGSVTAEGSPPEALDGSGIKLSGDGLSIDESLEGQSGFVLLANVPTVQTGAIVNFSGTFHHEEGPCPLS